MKDNASEKGQRRRYGKAEREEILADAEALGWPSRRGSTVYRIGSGTILSIFSALSLT